MSNRLDFEHDTLPASYELLDSSDGQRLERFGERTLARPCRLALWKRACAPREWNAAHARYNHKQGWIFQSEKFEQWS